LHVRLTAAASASSAPSTAPGVPLSPTSHPHPDFAVGGGVVVALQGAPAHVASQAASAVKAAFARQLEPERTRHELQTESAAQADACEQHVPWIQVVHAGRGSLTPPHVMVVPARNGAQSWFVRQAAAHMPPHWHATIAS